MRSPHRTVAIGDGRVRAGLFTPNPQRARRRQTLKGQVVMDDSLSKGFKPDCKISLIESKDGGRTHIGMYGDKQVKRVGSVNGILTRSGATAGRWVYV